MEDHHRISSPNTGRKKRAWRISAQSNAHELFSDKTKNFSKMHGSCMGQNQKTVSASACCLGGPQFEFHHRQNHLITHNSIFLCLTSGTIPRCLLRSLRIQFRDSYLCLKLIRGKLVGLSPLATP